mmetsp:Transcript_19658/g.48700  ORF Transcript_19658/g.48700 Transcript_19658/m.48700 type:complete len:305 (+) Transcript_19658:698-1612(+)
MCAPRHQGRSAHKVLLLLLSVCQQFTPPLVLPTLEMVLMLLVWIAVCVRQATGWVGYCASFRLWTLGAFPAARVIALRAVCAGPVGVKEDAVLVGMDRVVFFDVRARVGEQLHWGGKFASTADVAHPATPPARSAPLSRTDDHEPRRRRRVRHRDAMFQVSHPFLDLLKSHSIEGIAVELLVELIHQGNCVLAEHSAGILQTATAPARVPHQLHSLPPRVRVPILAFEQTPVDVLPRDPLPAAGPDATPAMTSSVRGPAALPAARARLGAVVGAFHGRLWRPRAQRARLFARLAPRRLLRRLRR